MLIYIEHEDDLGRRQYMYSFEYDTKNFRHRRKAVIMSRLVIMRESKCELEKTHEKSRGMHINMLLFDIGNERHAMLKVQQSFTDV